MESRLPRRHFWNCIWDNFLFSTFHLPLKVAGSFSPETRFLRQNPVRLLLHYDELLKPCQYVFMFRFCGFRVQGSFRPAFFVLTLLFGTQAHNDRIDYSRWPASLLLRDHMLTREGSYQISRGRNRIIKQGQ